MDNKKSEILCGIQSQIATFDNKAGLMLSVVGIVFALALSFIDVFHEDFYVGACECFKTWYTIVFCLFIFSAIVTILFFVLVIIPRKNKEETLYPNYYLDVCKMNSEQLNAALKDYSDKDELVIDQIRINSAICKRKHRWLMCGIVSLLFFVIVIVSLSLMIISI